MAPLGAGAVSCGGGAAPAAATQCAADSASRPCGCCGESDPESSIAPPPQKGLPQQYGSYSNIRVVLRHFRGELATEHRGSKELNVFPWSQLEGVGHYTWRAGKHLRPRRLHPRDLLDHVAKDHVTDPAQHGQAEAMIKGVMPRGLAGPFAVAQAGSKALAIPAGVHPSGTHKASSSATSSGARGSAAVSLMGGTGAGTGATRGGAARSTAVSRGARPATTS